MAEQGQSNIFILSNTLSKKYLNHLKQASLANQFKIDEKFEIDKTNIVVSCIENLPNILKILKLKPEDTFEKTIYFVKLKWLIDSNKKKSLCNLLDEVYLIGCTNSSIDSKIKSDKTVFISFLI
jgi:hypothetical protein